MAKKAKKYRVQWRCNGCDKVSDTIVSDLAKVPDNCPACKRKIGRMRVGPETQEYRRDVLRPGNVNTKAVDMTAEIVMKDYGMTDLKDQVRVGESSAPKLAPKLQAQADNMFSGNKAKRGMLPPNARAMGQAAIRGAYARPAIDPIAAVHRAKHQVATTYITEGKPKK